MLAKSNVNFGTDLFEELGMGPLNAEWRMQSAKSTNMLHHKSFCIPNSALCISRVCPRAELLLVVWLVYLVVTVVPNAIAAETSRAGSAGLLLVANKGDHTLGIIDPVAGRQIAAVPEDGVTGHEVAASLDGKRAFVPIYGDAGVGKPGTDGRLLRVIDLAKRAVVGTVEFGKGVRPHCAVVGPKNGLLYVTTELDDSVTVIDPRTLKIVGTVPTGQPESHMLAIPVCRTTQRISLSVDDRWVFTADQTQAQLAVIDTATNGVRTRVTLPGIAYGTAPTPDGRWLLVALIKDNQLGVVDLETMKVARTLEVPRAPQEVLVRPDGAVAYVSCDASRQVAVVDLKTWKVEKLIEAGPGADGLAWAGADQAGGR